MNLLIDLYREIVELTKPICSTCPQPYKCCEIAGCNQAKYWAKTYGIDLVETNGKLPFLTESGCTVAPHHRLLCSLWVCESRLKDLPPRYHELRAEIARLEAERVKGQSNGR